ncbi:MAG: anti-sigma factor [Candidatus Kapaibacterium sp.]
MSYKLTEKEKTLLSAYHDGELSSTEHAEVEKLLRRSIEARNWLRGADAVRTLSMAAVVVPEVASHSAKLTGSAIAAASRRGGVGTVSYMVHSPWTAVGLLSLLLIGAIYLMNPFVPSSDELTATNRAVPTSGEMSSEPVTLSASDTKSMVPPITPRDLIGFAVNGMLPVNEDRTKYLSVGSSDHSNEEMVRELESQLSELASVHLLTLDSLAKLLRSAVLQGRNGTYAVRQDLAALREDVIEQIERAPLSAKTSEELSKAKRQAQQVHEDIEDRLGKEMERMREALMAGGSQPYLYVDAKSITEAPTGDHQVALSFEQIGKRFDVVLLNPEGVTVRDQNVTIAALLPPASRQPAVLAKQTPLKSQSKPAFGAAGSANEPWEKHVTSVYMADVTITLSSNQSQIIISNDEETTLNSGFFDMKENSSTFYTLSNYLTKLTDSLNATVNRIVADTATSARERAGQILRVQDDYRQRVGRIIEVIRSHQEKAADPDSATTPNGDAASVDKDREEVRTDGQSQESALRDDAADATSPCPLQENCTGVS